MGALSSKSVLLCPLQKRSENTKYTFGNNEYLTPDLGGQFFPAKSGEEQWFIYPANIFDFKLL